MKFFKFLLSILVLAFSANVASAPCFSTITLGEVGVGFNFGTITISGCDIHSVHVSHAGTEGWTIEDEKFLFGPDWTATHTPGTGFSWEVAGTENVTPPAGGFHFSRGGDVGDLFLTSASIFVDIKSTDNIGTVTYPLIPTVPVPAPATFWLFGSGLIGILGLRKKFNFTA